MPPKFDTTQPAQESTMQPSQEVVIDKPKIARLKKPTNQLESRLVIKQKLTFEELQSEVRLAEITSSKQYNEEAPERGWIAPNTLKKQTQWLQWIEEGKNPWDEFLGREAFNFEKLQLEVRVAGIKSSQQYREEAPKKSWMSSNVLAKQPQWLQLIEEGKNPWDEFLGRESIKIEKRVLTFDELLTEVHTAGITSSEQYREESLKKGWMSYYSLVEQPQWLQWIEEGKNPWDEFLGKETKEKLTFEKLQLEVRVAGIKSSKKYQQEAPERGWMSLSSLVKQPQWLQWIEEGKNPWDEFLGREAFNFEKLQLEVRVAGVKSSKQYQQEAPERGWMSNNALVKQTQWLQWIEEGKNPWDKFLGRENTEEKEKQLEQNCDKFFENVAESKTIEAEEFKRLCSIFGMSQIFNILYKHHPEFKDGVKVEYIKGRIARYLGDFLVIRSGLVPSDIKLVIPHLSNPEIRDSFFVIVKADFFDYYNKNKNIDKEISNEEMFEKYLISLFEKEKSELLSGHLDEVIKKVEDYYKKLFNGFVKPENIANSLKEGRPFPDINQILNIQEIKENKRMLIGDEMGMGKSASAILAKESLGVKTALVIYPSNVEKTWQKYLSDNIEIDEETGKEKQIGCFKRGEDSKGRTYAPRVFTVEKESDLDGLVSGDWDYILVSQEKLDANYSKKLKALGCGMVIVDEVHKLKNLKEGARSKAALDITNEMSKDSFVVLLSGTPVPNKVGDIAMLLKLLYPEKFKDFDNDLLVSSIIKGEHIDLQSLLMPRMQMKSLEGNIEMPKRTEITIKTELSPTEKEVYELILEDDDLTASQKIQLLRKFAMNPSSLEIAPNIESSKITAVKEHLEESFKTKNKIVLVVNSYINGIIKGDGNIIDKFNLPKDIKIRIIHGEISTEERAKTEKEVREADGKMLIVLSGQTADVGVDFSSADHLVFYNEPWTKFDKQQQAGRVYRPGIKDDLTIATFVTENTIEEGIQEYIELKYVAVQKLLKGVPRTEIEESMLMTAEKKETFDMEGDLELAKEWLDSPQNRLHRFFGATKEIGQEKFHKFLLNYGEEYAERYLDMGSRGFQTNTSRVAGALIDHFIKEKKQNTKDLIILDSASGPEMLKTYIDDNHKESVVSLDINKAHFIGENDIKKEGMNKDIVSGFVNLPIANNSLDYINMSLALHYSAINLRTKEYERLQTLLEMNRVLKSEGRVVINLIHSLELKDMSTFEEVANAIGFKIVEDYTGSTSFNRNYMSPCIVLEKTSDVEKTFDEIVSDLGNDKLDGLKLKKAKTLSLKNSRHIIDEFYINGVNIKIPMNEKDRKLFKEQELIIKEGQELIKESGSIKDIEPEKITSRGFLRIKITPRNLEQEARYRLFKKGEKIGGFVEIIKE